MVGKLYKIKNKLNMTDIIIKEHTIIEDYLINKELVVIDLGACRGEFSNEINKLYKLKHSILVEPNPSNFFLLENSPNFTLINKAVSSVSNSTVEFREDVNSPYNGSLVFNYFENAKVHSIGTITLKELIDMANVTEIDILKVDIEGSEYDLLCNASNQDLLRFKQITVEFHDFVDPTFREKNIQIEEKLLSIGFKVKKKGISYKSGSDYYDTLFYRS